MMCKPSTSLPRVFVFIFVATTVLFATASLQSSEKAYISYVWKYKRTSPKGTNEYLKRYKIFQENVDFINAFNSRNKDGLKLGLGPFTDLTQKEFATKYLMKPVHAIEKNTVKITESRKSNSNCLR